MPIEVRWRVVLGYLAHGETTAHILKDFPSLAEEDVRAVIAFAGVERDAEGFDGLRRGA